MPKNKIRFQMRDLHHFRKYLSREDMLQGACITWLKMQYKDLLWCHPHNEGKRSPFERYRAKVVGIVAGVPDLLIFRARGVYNGLVIEFKVEDKGLSAAQINFLNALEKEGYRVEICRHFDQFKETVETYLAL